MNSFQDSNDWVPDADDNCDFWAWPSQVDGDLNGVGDRCDDGAGDGVWDWIDNCVGVYNPAVGKDQPDVPGRRG